MTTEQSKEILSVIHSYEDVFSDGSKLGCCKGYQHKIELEDKKGGRIKKERI